MFEGLLLLSSEQLVLSGLEPFTQYMVGVAALTRGPMGNFSADVLVRTRGDGNAMGPNILISS